MSKLRLGVIFGGQSSEYSVSLHSVASFLRQIHADNYDMTLIGFLYGYSDTKLICWWRKYAWTL